MSIFRLSIVDISIAVGDIRFCDGDIVLVVKFYPFSTELITIHWISAVILLYWTWLEHQNQIFEKKTCKPMELLKLSENIIVYL